MACDKRACDVHIVTHVQPQLFSHQDKVPKLGQQARLLTQSVVMSQSRLTQVLVSDHLGLLSHHLGLLSHHLGLLSHHLGLLSHHKHVLQLEHSAEVLHLRSYSLSWLSNFYLQ